MNKVVVPKIDTRTWQMPADVLKLFKKKEPRKPALPRFISSFQNCDGEGDRVVITFTSELSKQLQRDRFIELMLKEHRRYIRGVRWQTNDRVRITVWKNCAIDARIDAPKLASSIFEAVQGL